MIAMQRDYRRSARYFFAMLAATLAGLFLASMMSADDETGPEPPRRLKSVLEESAIRMDATLVEPESTNGLAEKSLAEDLRQVISYYETGNLEDAIDGWGQLKLPREGEVWRHLGLGVTLLCLDRLEDADDELMQATQFDPDNAFLHYFIGVLRIRQADASVEVSKVKERRYQLEREAISEFELAVQMAASFDPEAPLVPVHWVMQAPYPMNNPIVPPTVGKLADALWANNFVGKAHALLAYLYLDHGRMAKARYHAREAASLGIAISFGPRIESKDL